MKILFRLGFCFLYGNLGSTAGTFGSINVNLGEAERTLLRGGCLNGLGLLTKIRNLVHNLNH